MSKPSAEVDCTKKCHSRKHGFALTSAITKRSVQDAALASYIRATCANYTQAFDNEGRTALHMAASRGRHKLMEWLVRNSSEAFVNARDRESGYTPLHRSLFYGQVHAAVALMKIGVNTDIVDKDDFRALEHVMLDRQYMYEHEGKQPCDVYVWGSNSNYTLGTGAQQQKRMPDVLHCFSRSNISIKQVCLGKFHSVWVGAGGEVWACGQGSRFGASHAGTVLRPAPLRLPEPCQMAAVTVDSTVFLLESGVVIQYTLNNDDNSSPNAKNLSTIKLPTVKPLMKLAEPLGVCASRNHAVVWNKRAVYTWGVNVGQLGHSQPVEKVVDSPKRVAVTVNIKEEAWIEYVDASDAATVFTTSRGDVYLLHKYICKKIAIKQINLKQACVESKTSEGGATVLLLNNVGQVMIWQDTTNQLTRCIFGVNHQTVVTHLTLTPNTMFFTTRYGEAFMGLISRKHPTTPSAPQSKVKDDLKKSSLVKFLEKDECTAVKTRRIPNVHRAVSIAVDVEGMNYACLQIKPSCGLTSLPELSPSTLPQDMAALYTQATEEDLLHDVVFKVGSRMFPAHMFIIAAGSDLLYSLYQEQKQKQPDEKPTIILENLRPEVFERIILYLYTGTCDVVELGPCGLKIKKEELVSEGKKEKDAKLDVNENASEISAFEVYAKQNEKQKKNTKNRNRTNNQENIKRVQTHAYCDPVKLVQASAKRLQVMTLHKLLDKFYYRDGCVQLKESATGGVGPAPSPPWDLESSPELVDTTVRSKDGLLIPAHKCVLAARLEYFNGMFMHSWSESKSKSTVTLPVNHGILLPIVNFLYTDQCPEIETSDSIDFICNLLIVSDQLFVTRLREMCEVALAELITLKNCTELCQFAYTYNALQLKTCCMEFISLNICTLLENRSLEILNEELLEDITKYYCKINTIMASRIITPFYDSPDDGIIEEYARNYPVDLEQIDEEFKRDDVIEKKKSKSKKIEYTESEKARMRYESVSSVNSLDLSSESPGGITLALRKIPIETEKVSEEKQEKWVKVPTIQQKQQKVVQARLKAISAAKDLLNDTPAETFTKLTKNIASSPPSSPAPTTSRMSLSPKETSETLWRSPQSPIYISHVGVKLSQKQRKKLAMQGSDPKQNVDDLMNKLTLSESPTSKKNPWKVCEMPAVTSSQKRALEFNQILADQQKQKDNSSRIMTKSLTLTQLEDKAIEELEKFYNVVGSEDELITVRRIEIQVSSPQWIHTVPK